MSGYYQNWIKFRYWNPTLNRVCVPGIITKAIANQNFHIGAKTSEKDWVWNIEGFSKKSLFAMEYL